jgi:GntR family transcriptional regulator of vanillate catabolism
MQDFQEAARESQGLEVASHTGRTVLRLRELLLRGEFRPGERISELPLVARLGVSRTPIRLALERLSHEGLLEPSPSGGFFVRQFNLADIWDAIEMRGVLEGTAARLAAERLEGKHEMGALRICQDRMDSIAHDTVDSFARYMDLNEAFHAALTDLAKSDMLRRSLAYLSALPFAGPSAMVYARSKLPRAFEIFHVGQQQHHDIMDAIEQRQGTRAEFVAREHARLSRRNLETVLTDETVLNCVPGASLIKF